MSVPLKRTARGREAVILHLTSRRASPEVLDDWERLAGQHPVSTLNAMRQLLAAARFGAPESPPAVPMLVLETALPAKFAATIHEALGLEPDRPAALRGIEDLPKRFMVMPVDAGQVKHYIETHCA